MRTYGVRYRVSGSVKWSRHGSLEEEVLELLKRRPCRALDVSASLGLGLNVAQEITKSLRGMGRISTVVVDGEEYSFETGSALST